MSGGPVDWAKAAADDKNASAITWVGGKEGHVDLAEARRRHVESVAALEARMIEQTDAVVQLSAELSKAQRRRDDAYNRRQETRSELLAARSRLIKMFPLPPSEPS